MSAKGRRSNRVAMSSSKNPNRVNSGRIAALRMHAMGLGNTEPGRAGFLARFAREVDPDNKLSEVERIRRAALLRRAYMLELAQRSAEARARRARRRSANEQ